jgi:hypothetical protein
VKKGRQRRRETKEAWKMGRGRWRKGEKDDGGKEKRKKGEWKKEEGKKGLIQLTVKYS